MYPAIGEPAPVGAAGFQLPLTAGTSTVPGDTLNPLFDMPSGTPDAALEAGIYDGETDYAEVDPIDTNNIPKLRDKDFQERLGRYVRDAVIEWKSANGTGGRENNIATFRRIYECQPTGDADPQRGRRSRVVPPEARNQCDTIAARQAEALLGGENYLTIKSPLSPQDDESTLKCVHYAMYMFGEGGAIQHQTKLCRALRNIGTDGLFILHSFWNKKKRRVRRRVPLNNAVLAKMGLAHLQVSDPQRYPIITIDGQKYRYGQPYLLEFNETISDHFDYSLIDSRDFVLWPPESRSIESATIAGFLYEETPNEMRQKVNAGEYDKKAVEELVGEESDFMDPFTGYSSAISLGSTSPPSPNEGYEATESDGVSRGTEQAHSHYARRRLACLYCRLFDADRSKGDEDEVFKEHDDVCVVIDADSGKLLKCTLNPYDNGRRPFYEFGCDPRVGQGFYHYALMERLADLQQEYTALTRMGLDVGTQSTIKFVFQGPGRRKLSEQNLVHGINFLESGTDGRIEDIKEFNDVPASNFMDRNSTKQTMERTSGADESVQGTTVKGETTLGQTNLAVASGNIRMKFGMRFLLEAETWLFRQFFDYNMQFMEERNVFTAKINGKDVPMNITLNDMAVAWYSQVTAYSPIMDPHAALRSQQTQAAFAALSANPLIAEDPVKMNRLMHWYIRRIGIDEDMSAIMGTEEEWQQYAEEQQLRQMMAMQFGMAPVGAGQGGSNGRGAEDRAASR